MADLNALTLPTFDNLSSLVEPAGFDWPAMDLSDYVLQRYSSFAEPGGYDRAGVVFLTNFLYPNFTIFYWMRGYHTVGPIGYFFWLVQDDPDPGALQAPYPPGDISDVVVAATFTAGGP